MSSLEFGKITENLDYGNMNLLSGGFGGMPLKELKFQEDNKTTFKISPDFLADERGELEALKNSIPQVIREIVAKLKNQFGYKKYWIDDKPAKFDGIEVAWDEKTNSIYTIQLHILGEDGDKRDLPIEKFGEKYFLKNINGDISIGDKEKPDGVGSSKIKNDKKLNALERGTRIGEKPFTFDEGMEDKTKEIILEWYKPFLNPKNIRIPKSPDGQLYQISHVTGCVVNLGGKSLPGIRLDLKDQGGKILIFKKIEGGYRIVFDGEKSQANEWGVFRYGDRREKEGVYRYDTASGQVTIEPSRMQNWFDTVGKKYGISRNLDSGENARNFPLLWKNMVLQESQAKVIVALEGTEYDLGDGLSGKIQVIPDIDTSSLRVGMRNGSRWFFVEVSTFDRTRISRSGNSLGQKLTSNTGLTKEEKLFLDRMNTVMKTPLYPEK